MAQARSDSKARLLFVTTLCLFAVWLIYSVVMSLMAWHFAREVALRNPNTFTLPQPLTDMSLAHLAGPEIARFGYSLQSPSKNSGKGVDAKGIATVIFEDGGGMLVFDPSSEADSAAALSGHSDKQRKSMTKVFGAKALSSNYELLSAELEATPTNVTWWAMRNQNIRNFLSIEFKAMEMAGVSPAIHPITSGTMRGFQFGDPSVAPYRVKLELFDQNDRRYKIWISGDGERHRILTQAQINAVVASIHPLPNRKNSASANG